MLAPWKQYTFLDLLTDEVLIQTAGVVAAAAKYLGGGAMSAGYQGLSRGIGALSEAAGAGLSARDAAANNLTRGEDGYFHKDENAGGKAGRQAFVKSMAGSVGSAFKSVGHTLSHSLGAPSHSHSGGGGGLGSGKSKPPAWQSNPHSQAHQLSKTPGSGVLRKSESGEGRGKGKRQGRVGNRVSRQVKHINNIKQTELNMTGDQTWPR